MTRINVGIPPAELSREHLLAEHREIKRIPNAVSRGRFNLKGQPKEFTLGPGHVKFFYNKLLYLLNRYKEIYATCKEKKYNVQDHLMGDYVPTERDIKLIKERILQNSK